VAGARCGLGEVSAELTGDAGALDPGVGCVLAVVGDAPEVAFGRRSIVKDR
jgi:hypothetical protein